MSDADDPYVYPGTSVLRNRLGIADPDFLGKQERALVVLRSRRGVPRGNFDLNHPLAIHRHLFQDIYDWAGKLRTVEIRKGDQQFQFRQYIPTGMADVLEGWCRPDSCGASHTMLSPSRPPLSWATSTTSTPSARETDAPNSSISSSLPPKSSHARPDPHRGPGMDRGSVARHASDYSPMVKALNRALKPAAGGR